MISSLITEVSVDLSLYHELLIIVQGARNTRLPDLTLW